MEEEWKDGRSNERGRIIRTNAWRRESWVFIKGKRRRCAKELREEGEGSDEEVLLDIEREEIETSRVPWRGEDLSTIFCDVYGSREREGRGGRGGWI